MAGAWTFLNIKDALGTTRPMRAWDESGTGAGPHSFGQVLADGLGGAVTVTGGALSVTSSGSGGGTVAIKDISEGEYETVAASQTDQVLGATGATGDYLQGLLVVPATTSPGAISIKDGSGSAITVFTGGATSVSNLVPFFIPLGIISRSGAWKVTTGANVSCIGIGNFI
jgi:hypothetical protein